MKMKSSQEVFVELVERAQAGKHVEKKLIQNFREYLEAKLRCMDANRFARRFKQIASKVFKIYCKTIYKNPDYESSLMDMVNVRTLFECHDFYKEEAWLIQRSILEFKTYMEGRWFEVVFRSLERPEELQYDFLDNLNESK